MSYRYTAESVFHEIPNACLIRLMTDEIYQRLTVDPWQGDYEYLQLSGLWKRSRKEFEKFFEFQKDVASEYVFELNQKFKDRRSV